MLDALGEADDDAIVIDVQRGGERGAEAARDLGHVLLIEDQGDGAGRGVGLHGDLAALPLVEHDKGGGRDGVVAALGANLVLVLQRIAQRKRTGKRLRAGAK